MKKTRPKKTYKTKEQKLAEKIQKIYEQYPDRVEGTGHWDYGGFVNDEKYKQPIKHRIYR